MIDSFSRSNLGQNRLLLVVQFLGNQPKNGLTDNLFRRITKDARRSWIPTPNDAGEVLAHNGIIGRREDSCNLTELSGNLLLLQSVFLRYNDFGRSEEIASAVACGHQCEQCVHEISFARYLRGEAGLLAHAKNRVIDGRSTVPLKKDERFFGQLFDLEFPSHKAMGRGKRNNQRSGECGHHLPERQAN